MFTVQDIKREYERLDSLTENTISKIELEISNRLAKTRGKYCFEYLLKNKKIISEKIVIASFVLTEDEKFFMETIRHEYAHAMRERNYGVNDGESHDFLWKKCCEIVGCKGEATTEATEQQKAVLKNRKEYRIQCFNCGKVWTFHRKCKKMELALSGECFCPYCQSDKFFLEN